MARQPRRRSPANSPTPISARSPPSLRRSPRLHSSASTSQPSIRRSPSISALASQTHPEGSGQNTQGQATNAGAKPTSEETTRLPPIGEGKKKGSIAWDHFTWTDAKSTTATCNHCGKSVVCGNKVGTKTMLGHIYDYCKVHRVARKGAAAKSPRSEHKFSQDQSNRDFAYAVLKHNYALNMCEHIYFKHFLKGINPYYNLYYNLPCRATLRKEIILIFKEEKVKLEKLLVEHDSRVSLTTVDF